MIKIVIKYYNILFIDNYRDKALLHRIKLHILKKLLVQSNINATICTLESCDEDINCHDLAIFSLDSINDYKKFNEVYKCLVSSKIPMISWGESNELSNESSKKIFQNPVDIIDTEDMKIRFKYYKKVALNGVISQKLLENENYYIVGNPLICSSKVFNKKQDSQIFTQLINNQEYILLNFAKLDSKLDKKDSSWVYEQIEILIQILINNGNKIIVTSSDGNDDECNVFVNKFTNQSIKFISSNYSIYEMINLINMSKIVIDLGTKISMIATGLNKPFISIGYNIDYLDLRSIISMDDMFISVYEMNVGKLLDRIQKVDECYDEYINKLKLFCEKYFDNNIQFIKNIFSDIEPKSKKPHLLKNAKKKIVIINNYLYNFIPYIIDKNKCEIVAVLCDLNQIKDYEYDYILNCSASNAFDKRKLNINQDKLVDFSKWFFEFFDYEFYRTYYNFKGTEKNYEGIITGISYHEVSIDTKNLDKGFYNFAISGEDIFYNYIRANDLISNQKLKLLKYAILGLSYYSFQYDLSKTESSFGKFRSNIYYPFYNTMHNYKNRRESMQFYDKFKKYSQELFLDDYERIIYEMIRSNAEYNWNKMINSTFNSNQLNEKELDYEINQVMNDANKNYPLTVMENKEIFKRYLDLLVSNNVKPTIVICPVTNFYRKYFSARLKQEFYGIIKEFQNKYKFQIIDYYESQEFTDEDFYNSSHLNVHGAAKFTKILNNLISTN